MRLINFRVEGEKQEWINPQYILKVTANEDGKGVVVHLTDGSTLKAEGELGELAQSISNSLS